MLATLAVGSASLLLLVPVATRADLYSRQQNLQQGIAQDNGQIAGYEGRLDDLRTRLTVLQESLNTQRALLVRAQDQLAHARTRVKVLRGDLVRDRRILAQQLVAQYESPPPTLVGVVVSSRGFSQLLEQVSQMRAVAQGNALAIKAVARAKRRWSAAVTRLTGAVRHQRQVTAAVLIEREEIEGLRLDLLRQEHVAAADRDQKQAELNTVAHKLAALQASAAAAQQSSFAAPAGSLDSGGGAAPQGDYGFFPAPGTNYTVNEEPELARRLNRLGIALHLHLIGISGYRSPQHSVEVGGFADDPHTRGEASDTPGVEGVPEATLEQFGLTRPFPGPAEADHIQLLGSPL